MSVPSSGVAAGSTRTEQRVEGCNGRSSQRVTESVAHKVKQRGLRATAIVVVTATVSGWTQRGDGVSEQGGAADRALVALADELAACVTRLQNALERADDLRAARAEGRSWRETVTSEERPLIVERISEALDGLNRAGGRWRREEARALREEGMSINAIAALFGVTRQRASVLVREPGHGRPGADGGG
jgi:hypothetical protein